MNPDNPASRKLQNSTLLAILLPVYAAVMFVPGMGVVPHIRRLWADGAPFASPLVYLVAAALLASIAWVLLRGSLAGPVGLLVGTMLVYSVVSDGASGNKRYQLSIGAGRPVRGVDVYCNDVHLGKTPLTISETEFTSRVEPWDTPPAQPRLELDDRDNDRYSGARYTYVPNDTFDLWKQWPPDHHRYSRHDDAQTLEDLRTSKYWWRFEKAGCAGLTRLSNFGGGGGGGHLITISANPGIDYPSASDHLELLLAALEDDGHVPTPGWVEHFLTYKDLLFLDFHGKARGNTNLASALDAVVSAEFDMGPAPTETDCARVLDDILDRAESDRCFTVPSLESLAAERVARAHAGPLVERFLTSQHLSRGGSSGRASSGDWVTYRCGGPAARMMPLAHAVRLTTPPALFDRLVYMSRNGRYMNLLGNYPREELPGLFQHYLRQQERNGGRRGRSRLNEALRVCAQVHNPRVEAAIRSFIESNAVRGLGGSEFAVSRFIESRLGHPAIDQGELAGWIFHRAPLDDRDKRAYLPRIKDPAAARYLRSALGGAGRGREDAIRALARDPNPAFGRFIVESYEWYIGSRGPGYWSTTMTHALVKTDSPVIREALTEEWNRGKERTSLIKHLRSGDWRSPHMNWLVPMIAELTHQQQRLVAAELLSKIDTGDAYALAEAWSRDADTHVARKAREQLAIRDSRAADRRERVARARALIAGEMKPDDLLPPPSPYTWKDGRYVPVTGGE
jgi:hypothetical protein